MMTNHIARTILSAMMAMAVCLIAVQGFKTYIKVSQAVDRMQTVQHQQEAEARRMLNGFKIP
jgi:hypothetical protein